jgi:hypothetical protein
MEGSQKKDESGFETALDIEALKRGQEAAKIAMTLWIFIEPMER